MVAGLVIADARRQDVVSRADRDLVGLDRTLGIHRGDSARIADEASALLPQRVEQLVARQRSEVAEDEDCRQRCDRQCGDERVAQQGTTGDSRLFLGLVEDLERDRLILFAAADVMTFVDALMVAHEVLGPEHSAEADGEHRDSGTEADEHVVEADALHRFARREQEVRHDEPDGSDHREDEPGGYLPFGDFLGAWVRVGQARFVLGQTWVREPVQLLELAAAAGVLFRGH